MESVNSIAQSPLQYSPATDDRPKAGTAEVQSKTEAQKAATVSVSQSQTSDITIVTAEGDKVTISASAMAELSYPTYNGKGQTGQSSESTSSMAEIRTGQQFSLTVEGDLNKDELKDIRRALKTIMKATKDLLRGHTEKAADRTAKLSKLDQLASIDAAVTFTREVSISQAAPQDSSLPAQNAVPGAAPEPMETQPAETLAAPLAPSSPESDPTAESPLGASPVPAEPATVANPIQHLLFQAIGITAFALHAAWGDTQPTPTLTLRT